MIRRTAAGMLCFLMMMRRYCWRTGNETGLSWLRASPVYRLVINSEPTIAAGLCRAGGRCDCARIKSIPACVPKTRCVEKVRSASAPPPRDPSRSETQSILETETGHVRRSQSGSCGRLGSGYFLS